MYITFNFDLHYATYTLSQYRLLFFSFYGIMELGIFHLSFIEHSKSPLTKAYFAHTKQVLSCIIREIINQVITRILITDENYHTIFTFGF